MLEVDDDNAFNSASRIYRGQGHDDLLLCEGDLCACNFDPHMQNQPLVSDHAYSIGQIMKCTLSITLWDKVIKYIVSYGSKSFWE